MNKKTSVIVSVVVALFLVGGGIMAYSSSQNDKKEQENMAIKEKTVSMEEDDIAKESDSANNDAAMSKQGSYVTLEDYNKDPGKYSDSKRVYFFHASWCSICKNIDEEIKSDMSKIPVGVTIIKTDFDDSTDLRQKYGVTTQYTFVQVDNNGNETSKWIATSLQKAIDGIKS